MLKRIHVLKQLHYKTKYNVKDSRFVLQKLNQPSADVTISFMLDAPSILLKRL